jgi:hypothetical protein
MNIFLVGLNQSQSNYSNALKGIESIQEIFPGLNAAEKFIYKTDDYSSFFICISSPKDVVFPRNYIAEVWSIN